jgi:hypothetical protein
MPAPAPRVYLLNWRAILIALGQPSRPENRRQVRRLNDHYDGPILFTAGRGGQPKADRARLLAWWESLESVWAEQHARRRDSEATVAGRYLHGRNGEVVPGIAGSVQPRRTTT